MAYSNTQQWPALECEIASLTIRKDIHPNNFKYWWVRLTDGQWESFIHQPETQKHKGLIQDIHIWNNITDDFLTAKWSSLNHFYGEWGEDEIIEDDIK